MYSNIETIVDIESLDLNEINGSYLLDISIIADSKFRIRRYNVTAKLPIDRSSISIIKEEYGRFSIDLGFGSLPCVDMDCQIIKEKEQVMTLSEIEEKLGHRIKLVDDKK